MRITLFVFALFLSTQVYAAKTFLTGEKFVSEIKSGDMVKVMHALGYFHAIEDGLEAGGRTCRPASESTQTTLDGVISFIQPSDGASSTPAIVMVIDFLTKTFPCNTPPNQK